jgi:hypothetical protein
LVDGAINNHYTPLHAHIGKMKKMGFIKNKVMEAIITQNVEKTTFIPLTHMY